jgi:hypothetical protein
MRFSASPFDGVSAFTGESTHKPYSHCIITKCAKLKHYFAPNGYILNYHWYTSTHVQSSHRPMAIDRWLAERFCLAGLRATHRC